MEVCSLGRRRPMHKMRCLRSCTPVKLGFHVETARDLSQSRMTKRSSDLVAVHACASVSGSSSVKFLKAGTFAPPLH